MNSDHPQSTRWQRSEIWMLLAAALIVLASRLLWVMTGPGTDPDSFRVFNVAMSLRATGEYFASRLPGYPMHEFLVAALVHLGPAGTNTLSAFLSAVAFVFFGLILRRSGVRPYLLGALGFAFTPVVYINSTATIDYVPAITFVLAATYFVMSRRFIVSGICLGLAVGFRITSGAMVLPLVLWTVLNAKQRIAIRQSFQLVTTTLVTGSICFVPVFLRYGLGFFTFYDNFEYPSLRSLLSTGVLAVWGQVGVLALFGLCLLTPLYTTRIKSHLAVRRTLALALMASVSIAIYVAAFLRLPLESGYLVPVVPFTIMLFGLLLPPPYIRMLSLALVLSSFITVDRSGIALQGPILQDHTARVSGHQLTRTIVEAVERLPKNSIVVVGWELPAIRTYIQSNGGDLSRYVYLIHNQDACAKYQSDGRQVFFLTGMSDYNKKVYGIDLRDCHAQQLNM